MIRKDYLPFGKPNFSELEIAAVADVMRKGWVGMGGETIAFEQELATCLGASHVVTVNSCTSAIFLALAALGIAPGDEVICPSLTWCATANAALYLGAQPRLCDVDAETLSVTPATVTARLSRRTRAVIPVHFGGLAVDVTALRDALPAGVHIIEDAAHAFGSRFPNCRPVGSSGNLTCFSFYANKNLSTGEGGAIALTDQARAERLQSLRQNGMHADAWQRFTSPRSKLYTTLTALGYKMNYTDLQACIGRVQLRRQSEFAERRLQIATQYATGIKARRLPFVLQKDILDRSHARHLFVVRLVDRRIDRDELLLALRERNIGASVHYAPLHTMPLYADPDPVRLPVCEDLATRILTLPISASMKPEDADYVLQHLTEVLG